MALSLRAPAGLAASKTALPRRARTAALTCRAVATGPIRPPAPKDSLDVLIAEAIVHPPEQHAGNGNGAQLLASADVEARLTALRSLLDYAAHDLHKTGPPPALQLAMRHLEMRIIEKLEKRVSAARELGQLQQLVEASRYVEDEARD
ncbi:site-specific tyrosine recombinase [Chlorella sorokiniana]|jgi:hypothetical protein|uniref:Site-specific tyrosine recombinase n=1 Tax=Chlorella sorokiniana TaxID=3076 RepID=A0A2P6TUE0_CHLSO|nr:site-specific tyrosine recombinase [Chlorella sorokiniana]|eukprot:PRW57683.1 site-specific tyrosine recombinase [Chlorella sorokiniana]